MWDNVAEVMDTFDRDHFVKVKGLVQLHLNRPQLTIHKIRILQDDEVDFDDYFPASLRNRDEMWAELRATVARVSNLHIRGLLDALLDDDDIAKRYRIAPAAKTIHHAYLGGLLEHVLSLCRLCQLTASHYPNIDPDLMTAGAVLHDIGKIHELTYERGFGYSTEGQLLGHMSIGLRMMGDKLRALPDFPSGLRTMLEHMVISHHGKLEFGSAKLPLFPEALLLHYLDDMDSKMECMRYLIDGDGQSTSCFTSYNMALERSVFKKDRFLAPPVKQEPAAEPAAPAPVKPPSSSPFAEKLQLALVGQPSADSKA
jgi:3'-5' exoribonuclease